MAPHKRCSVCRRPNAGPVATGYWRYIPDGHTGVGYRLYYCQPCWKQLTTNLVLQSALDLDDKFDETCGVCGSGTAGTAEIAYLYLYPPGLNRTDFLVPTCGPCLNIIQADISRDGTLLDNRDQFSRTMVERDWLAQAKTD